MAQKKTAFAALAAAAAMPIVSQAEVAPEDEVFAYRYSQYSESDNPRERTFTPELKRYEIDVHQFRYAKPLGEDWYINSEFQYETLSGASPTQTYREDGKSVLITSGATIDETRYDVKVSPKRYFSEGSLGGTFAFSTENDYQSISLGTDGSLELFNKHTTLLAAISASIDTLSPSDANGSPNREAADGRNKRSLSLYEGVSQIIDKNRVIQVGLGVTHFSGFLSDPYKTYDKRPSERDQFTISANYRHYFAVGDGAAFHADYRFYADDWGILSHTLSARWAQRYHSNWAQFRFIPSLRYYRQSEADFYTLDRVPQGEYFSSDARLSNYGAITLGLENQANWRTWTLSFDFQYYFADETLSVVGRTGDETPSLLSYTVLSFGVAYRF